MISGEIAYGPGDGFGGVSIQYAGMGCFNTATESGNPDLVEVQVVLAWNSTTPHPPVPQEANLANFDDVAPGPTVVGPHQNNLHYMSLQFGNNFSSVLNTDLVWFPKSFVSANTTITGEVLIQPLATNIHNWRLGLPGNYTFCRIPRLFVFTGNSFCTCVLEQPGVHMYALINGSWTAYAN
jgi:hypothetical protein